MAVRDVVTREEIGNGLAINANKVEADLKADSGLVFDGNKIDIDTSLLGELLAGKLKVVSGDAGNIISIGDDRGAKLTADAIKDVVGDMVASATDGIDYDALAKVLTTKIKSLAVTDSSTIDFTLTDTDGDEAITGKVKVSSDTNNAITVEADGLKVPKGSAPVSTISGDIKTETFPDGSTKTYVKWCDLAGNNCGWLEEAV